MTALLVVAALAMLVLGVGALAGAAGVMRASQRLTSRRVDTIIAKTGRVAAALSPRRAQAQDLVRRVLGVGIHQAWASKISTRVLAIAAVGGSVAAFAILFLALHAPVWIWAPATALGMVLPPQLLLRMEQSRLEARFVDVFPDAIDMIVRMLRAGLPMAAAIGVVGREAGSPVREVFAAVSDQMTMGASFDRALVAAGKQVRPQDFKFFTVAAALQQSTGGNLAVTLQMLSEIIRKRRAGRMKAKAVTAEVRMSAYVLAAIPFVVIAGLMVINPGYLLPLVRDPRGWVIVGVAIGLLLGGFLIMAMMMKSATRL